MIREVFHRWTPFDLLMSMEWPEILLMWNSVVKSLNEAAEKNKVEYDNKGMPLKTNQRIEPRMKWKPKGKK